MITDNNKKWHYLFVKRLPALLKGITTKHSGYFYCLNCFYSFRTKNVFKKHENVYKNHYDCHVEIPNKDNNILKYNYGEKAMKVPFLFMLLRRLCSKKLVLVILILMCHQQLK